MKYIYILSFILLLIIFRNNILNYVRSMFITDDNIHKNLEYIYDINNEITYYNLNWDENLYLTHIIITRYNEKNIDLLLKPIINKKNVIIYIYNKGDEFLDIPNDALNIKIIKIPNLGWDSYGYITHIINNYNNLPDFIFSIHASAELRLNKFKLYLSLINKSKILSEYYNKKFYYGGDIQKVEKDFRIFSWYSTTKINNKLNNKNKLASSKIYPFENWLKSKIKKIKYQNKKYIMGNYCGMFCTSKSSILLYSKQFYIDILDEISVWQSEVNHYLERSWYNFYN